MRLSRRLTASDPAEDLTSDVAIATFMVGAVGSGDESYIEHALGGVVRAKHIARIGNEAGLSREPF